MYKLNPNIVFYDKQNNGYPLQLNVKRRMKHLSSTLIKEF